MLAAPNCSSLPLNSSLWSPYTWFDSRLRKRQNLTSPFRGEFTAESQRPLRRTQRGMTLCVSLSGLCASAVKPQLSSAVPILCLTRASRTGSNFFTRPKNPYAVIVMALAVTIIGSTAISRIPTDILPTFNTPAVQIITFYPVCPPM